jgi:hypothetical protein
MQVSKLQLRLVRYYRVTEKLLWEEKIMKRMGEVLLVVLKVAVLGYNEEKFQKEMN